MSEPKTVDWSVLDRLIAVIESRRGADPASSYVAKLLAKGRPKLAQKVGEEAVETAIAAVEGDAAAVTQESADLIFHLFILWAEMGVGPDDVLKALEEREGRSGLAEKAARGSE